MTEWTTYTGSDEQIDPLREMKIRQTITGQPVWVKIKTKKHSFTTGVFIRTEIYKTTATDWNIPNAEYSFTTFDKEEV